MAKTSHRWNFFRAGGFDQVRLDSGSDLLELRQLDQKLWVALSCPTRGIEFDNRTLDLIDTDGDGQVRANEVLAAIDWAGALLNKSELLVEQSDHLLLSEISSSTEEGRQVLSSARHILGSLGKAEVDSVSLQDIADIEKIQSGLQLNGDGVICANQFPDSDLRTALEDIAKTTGSVADVSGEQGINQEIADKFFAEAKEYADWYAKSEANPALSPLGADSSKAGAALGAIKEKFNDYFTRCQLAAYDARAASPLSRSTEDYEQLAAKNLSAHNADVAAFPLATIAADKPLNLDSGINPAWIEQVAEFRMQVIKPLLGAKSSLTGAEWASLCARFDAFEAWQNEKPASSVGELGIARIKEMISGDLHAKINSQIERDKSIEVEIKSIHSVERLIRYQRDLFRLVNNFVSFRDFYSGKQKAIFQVGTLYLDGRSCELCIKVEDVDAHAAYANTSGVCLAYCELIRNGGADKMNIAAAFTAGDSDFLLVGRHGVFYDRKGQDWNATIVRIADHPISIRQSFWSPYKKLIKAISEQLQKFAASKASAVQEKLIKTVIESGNSAVVAVPNMPPKPAFDVAKFAGIFAAIGLAIGAIGGILASIVAGLFGLKFWQVPLALVGLILLISGPSMMLAWFKLKRRNLGPILDACGWAINARVHINIPFGTSLTALPNLPAGAQRSLADPFAEKKSIWPYIIGILVLIGLIGYGIFF